MVEDQFIEQQEAHSAKLGTAQKAHVTEETTAVIPPLHNQHLILVDLTASVKNLAAYKPFIQKIMKAVGITIQEVDLVDMQKLEGVTPREVMTKSEAKYVITFGLNKGQQAHFDLIEYGNKMVLVAKQLAAIETDKEAKMRLWKFLQKMYNLG